MKRPNHAVEHYATNRGEVHRCRWGRREMTQEMTKACSSMSFCETTRHLSASETIVSYAIFLSVLALVYAVSKWRLKDRARRTLSIVGWANLVIGVTTCGITMSRLCMAMAMMPVSDHTALVPLLWLELRRLVGFTCASLVMAAVSFGVSAVTRQESTQPDR